MMVETNLRPRACYLGREAKLAMMGDEQALCPASNGRDAKYHDCSDLGERGESSLLHPREHLTWDWSWQ